MKCFGDAKGGTANCEWVYKPDVGLELPEEVTSLGKIVAVH